MQDFFQQYVLWTASIVDLAKEDGINRKQHFSPCFSWKWQMAGTTPKWKGKSCSNLHFSGSTSYSSRVKIIMTTWTIGIARVDPQRLKVHKSSIVTLLVQYRLFKFNGILFSFLVWIFLFELFMIICDSVLWPPGPAVNVPLQVDLGSTFYSKKTLVESLRLLRGLVESQEKPSWNMFFLPIIHVYTRSYIYIIYIYIYLF